MTSRVPIPQLAAIAASRRVSLSQIAAVLGMSRSAFHELRKHPDGIARAHAEAIATYLSVPLSTLTAPPVAGDGDAATVTAHPSIAAATVAATDAVTATVRELVAETVATTLRLIASGAIPTPTAAPADDLAPYRAVADASAPQPTPARGTRRPSTKRRR